MRITERKRRGKEKQRGEMDGKFNGYGEKQCSVDLHHNKEKGEEKRGRRSRIEEKEEKKTGERREK